MKKDATPAEIADRMLDPRIVDASEELVHRTGMSDDDVAHTVEVMRALRRWHQASERMSEASNRYMRLNSTDMRALRFLIAAHNQGAVVTPGQLSEHLAISTAATTKMLDRLEAGHHVLRAPHPTDRRSLAITVTEHTRRDARETVGRQHARRFDVAAALVPEERDVVIRFLDGLSATEVLEDAEDGLGAG
ncbi:MarR family winged helix-turn-helix transcriptional regulator [Agromyces sp. MMS24-JH15]|uniref:MarR family winged helix-turn-helix transcriptional regulator n=1 Tax=Agromyces sp. MMS24-JH15 TaxID=3243765 RepID=UPI003747D13A